MSVVDFSSRLSRVFITNPDGSNSLDVSDIFLGIELNDPPLGTPSEAIATTGTLELNIAAGTLNGESLHPYENPERFSRGMRIYHEVLLSDGVTYAPSPRAELNILKRPAPPRDENNADTQVLRISVGCDLALKNYRRPPDDSASCIPLGQSTNPDTIISRIAAKAGLPQLEDAITEYPLDYPVYDLEGNFVELMANIAYARGYVLWMDNQKRLRATKIDLDRAGGSDFRFIVGRNEEFFDALPGSERPVELVRVTAVTSEATDPTPEDRFDVSANPTEIRQTTHQRWRTNTPYTTYSHRIEKGQVFPEEFPGNRSMITRELQYDEKQYAPVGSDPCDPDSGSELIRRTLTKLEPRGLILPDDFPGETARIFSYQEVTTYTYIDDEIRKIRTLIREPNGKVNPSTSENTKTQLVPSQLTIREWTKRGDRYQESTFTKQFGEIGDGGSASGVGNDSGSSSQPPGTERAPGEFTDSEEAIEGEATFSVGPGSEFDEREREFQLQSGVAVSEEQLDEVARTIGLTLQGRDFGYIFGLPLTDQIIQNWKPLMVMDWTYRNRRIRYLANALNLLMNKEEAIFGGELIEIAEIRVFDPAGNYIPPTAQNVEVAPGVFVDAEELYNEYSATGVAGYVVDSQKTNYGDVGLQKSFTVNLSLGSFERNFSDGIEILGYDVEADLGTIDLGNFEGNFQQGIVIFLSVTGAMQADDVPLSGLIANNTGIEAALQADDVPVSGLIANVVEIEAAIAADDIPLQGAIANVVGIEAALQSDDIPLAGVLDSAEAIRLDGAMQADDVPLAGVLQPPAATGLYQLPNSATRQLWLNAQNGVTPDVNGSAQWDDNSGNNRHATRFSGNFQQVFSALNGFTVLDGEVNAVLQFPELPASTTWTIFVVAQVDADTFILGHSINYQIRVKRSGAEVMSFFANGGDRVSDPLPVATSNYAVYEWVIDGNQLDMLQNGVSVYSGANNSANLIWSLIGRTTGVTSSDIKLADIIADSSVLSVGDRTTIRTTLLDRYNLNP